MREYIASINVIETGRVFGVNLDMKLLLAWHFTHVSLFIHPL